MGLRVDKLGPHNAATALRLATKVVSSLRGIYSKEAIAGEIEPLNWSRLHNPDYLDLVLFRDSRCVGFCFCEIEGGVAFLRWLGVEPAELGTGAARYLFEDLLRKCRNLGVRKVWFDTNAANVRAINFFESYGCAKFGTVEDFWYGHSYHFWEKRLSE